MTGAKFLLDTNVVSEMARVRPDPNVVAFFAESARYLVSVIVFHELQFGCEALSDPQKRERVGSFVADVRRRFTSEALPVTLEIADTAARIRASGKREGRMLVICDALIAATCIVHELTLVTRNVKDFQHLSLPILNPFLAT